MWSVKRSWNFFTIPSYDIEQFRGNDKKSCEGDHKKVRRSHPKNVIRDFFLFFFHHHNIFAFLAIFLAIFILITYLTANTYSFERTFFIKFLEYFELLTLVNLTHSQFARRLSKNIYLWSRFKYDEDVKQLIKDDTKKPNSSLMLYDFSISTITLVSFPSQKLIYMITTGGHEHTT